MEDEIITKSEKSSSLAPVIGFLGLGLGVIAIALGIFAMFKVGATSANMNEKIEKAAALALDIKKMSDRIDSLALQIENIKSDDKTRNDTIIAQVNEELKKVYAAVDDTRSSVSENRKAIEEIAKRSTSRKAPAAETAQAPAAESAAADQPAAASAGGKTHKIQGGDTFGKLAKKYNVTVEAIIKANPDVNPSRLKIGQEIAIP